MAEYIRRDTVLRCIKESRDGINWGQSEDGDAFLHYSACLYRTIASAECIPAAAVVERKTGKWIYPSDITGFGRCSECKALWDYSLITNKYFKICPRCGSYNGGDEDV